jgi:UDP-glucuronate decarboxylase
MDRFSSYIGRKDIEFIIQDVCTPILEKVNFDLIVCAASQASPKYFGIDPVGTIMANTIGTANLLMTATNCKSTNFLFFSSGEIYGEVKKENIPIKENVYGYLDPTVLRSCYAEGKRAGENICVSWNNQYGVPVKIIRPFHIYGPGILLDDGRVYADFIADIVLNRSIKIKSDGSAIRAFCYISDAVVGFFTVLLKGENLQPYNVGNEGCEISIKELAYLLVDLFPEKKLKVELNAQLNQDGYIKSNISYISPDTSKLRNLGWKSCYSLEEGFKRTIKAFLLNKPNLSEGKY